MFFYDNYISNGGAPIVGFPYSTTIMSTYHVTGLNSNILTITGNSFSCAFPVPFYHNTIPTPPISTWNNNVGSTISTYDNNSIQVIAFTYRNTDFFQVNMTFLFPSQKGTVMNATILYNISGKNANYYQMLQ